MLTHGLRLPFTKTNHEKITDAKITEVGRCPHICMEAFRIISGFKKGY